MEQKINKENNATPKVRQKSLNTNFLDFIKTVKERNLSGVKGDKLKAVYSEWVKLKPTNIERVFSRTLRVELKTALTQELKKRDLEIQQFKIISEKVIENI